MNIGIDIDDTIADTFNFFIPVTAEYTGRSIAYLEEHDISYDCLPPEWNIDTDVFYRKYFDEYVPRTPLKAGAREAVKKLKEEGHRIVFITHRNNTFYTDCYKTTYAELANMKMPYDKVVCTQDKAKACLDEKIDFFVDDGIVNCEAVAELGIPVRVFSSRKNRRENTTLPRVESWEEILSLISILSEGGSID
jgi:Uncharacterized conserved protein